VTRAFPLDYRDLRERGSVLPRDYHDPLKSAFPPDSALREKRARLQDEQQMARRALARRVRWRKLFGRQSDRGPIL
jgi:hypothetical protein